MQSNSIVALGFCLPLVTAVASCNKGAEPYVKEHGSYQYIEVKEKPPSTASPLGYWEKTLRYPQLGNGENSRVVTAINDAIIKIANQYKCDTEGDQGFESEVTLANSSLFSFKYNAMWLCDTMLRPDSTLGAATYDLETGAELKLADSLLDNAAADTLRNKVLSNFVAKINEKNKSGANCPAPTPSEIFYLKDGTIVFRASYVDHADSACEVETSIALVEVKDLFKPDSKLLGTLQPSK